MSQLPKKDIWDLKRECYLWTGDDDADLQKTHLSQICDGDMFVLEAQHAFDPLHGLVVAERVYVAAGDAWKEGGQWLVQCDPI